MGGSFDPALLHHPAGMVLFVLAYAVAELLLLPAAPATVLAGSVYGLALGSAVAGAGADAWASVGARGLHLIGLLATLACALLLARRLLPGSAASTESQIQP